MTGVFLWVLGLAATGATFQPNYQGVQPVMDAIIEQQQLLQEELERNYLVEQEQIIIEDYFLFLDKIGKIKYARGCMGEYTPPSRSEEKQKRVRCSDNTFDCAGLVKAYGIAKGIITQKEATHYNSQSLMTLATKKHATLAQRGDRTSRQGFGERSTGNLSTHFAMISRDYTGGNTLRVYDNVNGSNNNTLGERPLRVAVVRDQFYYLGKYRITVYSNGFVEEARRRDITVERRYDTEPEEEADPINPAPPETNPHGYSVIVSGFAYDSDANKIASRSRDNGGSKKMIAKRMGESHFNIHAKGKNGEDGLCQLMYNETNKIRIDDPRRATREFQAQICLEKREAVPNPDKIRFAPDNLYMNKIHFID